MLDGTLLEIEQGTPEWHRERLTRIGASEVSALFQESPYYTKRELYLFKKGLVPEWFIQDNDYIFNKGHEFEEKMRAEWFALTGEPFKPTVRINNKYPHLIASLDGEFEDSIFEAKLIGSEKLEDLKTFAKPPKHHWIQVQQQLLITNAFKCVYFAHTLDGDGAVIDIFPDKDFQQKIIDESLKFQDDLINNKEPEMTKDDFFFADDNPIFDELRELEIMKSNAKKTYEKLDNEYKEKLNAFHSSIGHRNIANIKAKVKIKTMCRSTINWLSIPEVAALSKEYIESFKTNGKEYLQAWFSK